MHGGGGGCRGGGVARRRATTFGDARHQLFFTRAQLEVAASTKRRASLTGAALGVPGLAGRGGGAAIVGAREDFAKWLGEEFERESLAAAAQRYGGGASDNAWLAWSANALGRPSWYGRAEDGIMCCSLCVCVATDCTDNLAIPPAVIALSQQPGPGGAAAAAAAAPARAHPCGG